MFKEDRSSGGKIPRKTQQRSSNMLNTMHWDRSGHTRLRVALLEGFFFFHGTLSKLWPLSHVAIMLGQAMAMFSVSSCFQLEMTNTPWDAGVGDESTRLQISWTTRDLILACYTNRTHTSNCGTSICVSHEPACTEVRFLLYSLPCPVLSHRLKGCPCLQKPSPGPLP